MTFSHPEYLYLLFALCIPVIIHLFNFRRHKKMYFSDISRLKNITTHTRKQHKLKHIIVLLLRLFTLLFIIIALSGPIIKEDRSGSVSDSKTIAIYIDNSFSMMAEGNNGRLFEEARKEALRVVELSVDNASFIILTNDNNGNLMRLLGKEAAISEIENLDISAGTKKISQLIDVRNRIMSNNNILIIDSYFFSDFQIKLTDLNNVLPDTLNQYFLVPLKHLVNRNIFIDSLYIDKEITSKNTNKLIVAVTNDSDNDYEKIPLKLSINNQQKAVAGFDIKAGTTKKISLNYSSANSGWQRGVVEVENYPITFDDKLFFSYKLSSSIDILIIGNNNDDEILRKFYSSDDIFSVSEMNFKSIDFGRLNDFDLIILNSIPDISSGLTAQLKEFVNQGGNLLFIPPQSDYTKAISVFFNEMQTGRFVNTDTSDTRVTRLKLSNKIFAESVQKVPVNAELPTIFKHYKYNFPANSNVETLVSLLSGDDFLSKKKIGAGELYILAVGLGKEYGNFTSQLLFSPIMHGIASKRSSSNNLYYILGQDKNIIIPSGNIIPGEKPTILESHQNNQTIIPVQKYGNHELNIQIENLNINSGYYNVIMEDSLISVLAFNYNRIESDMHFYNSDQLNELCLNSPLKYYGVLNPNDPEYTDVINELQKESDFWKLFIIFALFVILIEILILRYWK
jgi:aerotolerance regulator-like protein